jgi:hypothetical protein
MEWESWTQRGLREYFRMVADACGVEAFSVQFDPSLSGYLPLDTRVPEFPDLDVALVWDESTGWCSVRETPTNELVVLSYLGAGVLPAPNEVAAFAANPTVGTSAPVVVAGVDVHDRLAKYAMMPLAG